MQEIDNIDDGYIPDRHLLPYGTSASDAPIRLIDRAKEIETATQQIQAHVNGKLDVILKQIRILQEEAKKIMEDAVVNSELHQVKCNFEKKIGQILHLYQRDSGEKYFSLISPAEWGKPPHRFLGSFQLKPDQSFEKILF
jgi:hypothetical protein